MAAPSQTGKYGAPYILDAANEEISSAIYVREIWWQTKSPSDGDDLKLTDTQGTPLTILEDAVSGTNEFFRRYPIHDNLDKGLKVATIDSGQVFVFAGFTHG